MNHVTRFRQQLGLTSYALAQKVGVAVSTIRRIETGAIKNPHALTRRRIAEVLRTTENEVFPDVQDED